MSAAPKWDLISVDEYLAGELHSSGKHEYLGGVLYAMAGGRNAHGIIGVNIVGELRTRLRGMPCRPFNSDTKIRVQLPTQVRFYYPDASVVCRPNPQTDTFQDEPAALFEILSGSTRRIDEGEKKDAYLTANSLYVYLLVEQESATVVVHRRADRGFVREVYHGLDATVPLPEIGIALRLADIYEGVEFHPEACADDAE